MMRYVIKGQEDEEVMEFSLEKGDDGEIFLAANGYYLLDIHPERGIGLIESVPESLGLDVDEEGKIKVVNN